MASMQSEGSRRGFKATPGFVHPIGISFSLTTAPYWSIRCSQGGRTVAVRATRLGFRIAAACGLLWLGLAAATAVEPAGSGPAKAAAGDFFPIATDIRVGGDETQTRLVVDL